MLNQNDLLIIIDMNNGFVKKGALSSPNVLNLVPKMQKFVKKCIENKVEVWHYIDSHSKECLEFNVYPAHCIEDSVESKVIDELNFDEIKIIKKNSTNGFLRQNPFSETKNIFIIGCVTDICIFDFAYTAIKYVQEYNLNLSVNVIENLCATFDAPNHNSKEIHNEYINKLHNEGVNVISI